MSSLPAGVTQKQLSKFEESTDSNIRWAQNLELVSPSDAVAATERVRAIKVLRDAIYEEFEPARKSLDTAKKDLLKLRNKFTDPLDEAERLGKSTISTFQIAQEKAQQKELLRKAAESQKLTERTAERITKRIEKAEDSGDLGRATELKSQLGNLEPAPIVAETIVPKLSKARVTQKWSARIVDPNLVPREYCIPDAKALNAIARATKRPSTIAGVIFDCENSMAVGTKGE